MCWHKKGKCPNAELVAENVRLQERVERLVREGYQFQPDEDGEGGVTWRMAFADHDMLLMDAERRVTEAEALAERRKEALKRFGEHDDTCPDYLEADSPSTKACDCGLGAAIEGKPHE